MWNYIIAPILSFLPGRWRRGITGGLQLNWRRAALLSGALEFFLFAGGLVGWYFYKIGELTRGQYDATMQATQGIPGYGAGLAVGGIALINFWMHPLTWVLLYFCIEGLMRSVAAMVTEEAHGTLPLALLDGLLAAAGRRAYEARVPLVPDMVVRGDGKQPWDLMVTSCRPKPSWRYPATIEYDGQFYQVQGEAPGSATPSRPHVYLLKHPPPGEAYRGVERYSPTALLEAEKPRFFLAAWLEEKREQQRIRSLPLVADTLTRGDGGQGWHLKIESCRPKPDWTPGRTVRFEDQLYRVEGSFQAGPQRPFGYRLRLQLPSEAARGMMDYSPDEPLYLHKK